MNSMHEPITNSVRYFRGEVIPSMVEFNLLNYCNRSCKFCPVIIPADKKELSLELFIKVMMQLQDWDYDGLISFSGFSEPLYHSDLYHLVDIVHEYIPDAWLTINTNGDKLTQDMGSTLFRKGTNYIQVSQYEENVDNKRIKWYSKYNKPDAKIIIRDRYSNEEFVNGRAGAVFYTNPSIDKPCFYPYYSLYINWNGDTSFCPHDYRQQVVLGNVEKKSLWSMWTGDKLKEVRENVRSQKPCNFCDVCGDKFGKGHYEELHPKR